MVKQYNNEENQTSVDAYFAFQEDVIVPKYHFIMGHLSFIQHANICTQP